MLLLSQLEDSLGAVRDQGVAGDHLHGRGETRTRGVALTSLNGLKFEAPPVAMDGPKSNESNLPLHCKPVPWTGCGLCHRECPGRLITECTKNSRVLGLRVLTHCHLGNPNGLP